MPSVVTFWQLVDDEREFVDFLDVGGDVRAVPDCWVRSLDELEPRPVPDVLSATSADSVLLGLHHQVRSAAIVQHVLEGQLYYSLSDMDSCLIGYARVVFREDGALGQSNLHAYWDYLNKNLGATVRKDPEFVEWAKKVFRWVRRFTPESIEYNGFPYRATRRARQSYDRGEITVGF